MANDRPFSYFPFIFSLFGRGTVRVFPNGTSQFLEGQGLVGLGFSTFYVYFLFRRLRVDRERNVLQVYLVLYPYGRGLSKPCGDTRIVRVLVNFVLVSSA